MIVLLKMIDHTVDVKLLHLGLAKHNYWKFEKMAL